MLTKPEIRSAVVVGFPMFILSALAAIGVFGSMLFMGAMGDLAYLAAGLAAIFGAMVGAALGIIWTRSHAKND